MFYPLWISFCVCCKLVFLYHFFAYTSPVFSAPLIKDLSLLYCRFLPLLSNINCSYRCRFIPQFFFLFHLFCSTLLDLYICYYASTRLLLLQWPCSSLKPEVVIPLALLSVHKITEAMWGPFWFHIKFYNICTSSMRGAIGILIGIAMKIHIAKLLAKMEA